MGIKPNQYFWLEGKVVKNLHELANSLEKMPKKVFDNHVNTEKNDFENWIREVVQDKELAEKITAVKTPKTMAKYIKDKLQKSQTVDKQKQIAKKLPEKHKEKDIMKKMQEMISNKPEVPNVKIKQTKIKLGHNCPYKSIKCSLLELLIGVIIGLVIGLIISGVM